MTKWLLGTALALGLAAPAHAANTALAMWTSADPADIVSTSGFGSVDLGPQDLGGVTVTLSFANRLTAPNQITEGNINIDNTSSSVQTLNIVAGANGFLGPDLNFALSGTILAAVGASDLAGNFFADQSNGLNGLSTTVTGTSVGTFDSGSLTGPHSFSFNGDGLDSVVTPYGMAERLTLTLQPGAEIAVQGMSMTSRAIPEPGTWAMLIAGFGLMALVGRKAKKRLAIY